MANPVSIVKTVGVHVELTVRDLAEAFATLAADEQAEFFEHVENIFKSWESPRGAMQKTFISNEIEQRLNAKWFIEEIRP